MDPKVDLLDEDPSVTTEEERLARFGQNDHKRVFGMKAEQFLTDAGFEVERINGDDCPKEIVPVVGPGDYDINRLFAAERRYSKCLSVYISSGTSISIPLHKVLM